MKRIIFKKDGSKMIKLGRTWFRPLTLEGVLNTERAFFSKNSEEVEKPIPMWFNYKGLTYVKA